MDQETLRHSTQLSFALTAVSFIPLVLFAKYFLLLPFIGAAATFTFSVIYIMKYRDSPFAFCIFLVLSIALLIIYAILFSTFPVSAFNPL